jgi:hypothetical protein
MVPMYEVREDGQQGKANGKEIEFILKEEPLNLMNVEPIPPYIQEIMDIEAYKQQEHTG